ncbi:MAG: hypothetical protein ACOYJF_04900 [Prevotella sp.]|jgi:hypothetical protein
MKKIFLFATVVAAMTVASCGNKSQSAAPAADSVSADSVEQVDTAALSSEVKTMMNTLTGQLSEALKTKDPKALTTSLANLEVTYKTLVNSGQLEAAKSYGSAVKQFVNENAETIKTVASGNTTVASLVEGIKNLPTTAETTAEQAKAAVSSDAISLASAAIAKGADAKATVETATEALKNLPSNLTEAANTAANTAVENAKTQAENKVNEKVNSVKEKANNEVNKAAQKATNEVNKAASKAVNSLFN